MNTTKIIQIYDTTLRDGLQRHGLDYSLEDKLKITRKLARLGIPFIEGGWPRANPVDTKFFKRIQKEDLGHTQVVAFGSTRHPRKRVEDDPMTQALLDAQTLWVTIFGKTWDLHVKEALKVDLDTNLAMIQDTINYLVANERRVIYDAEHWFDGYKTNPDYALQTLSVALTAGAEWLVLCDTNGGTLPHEIHTIVAEVRQWLSRYKNHFPTLPRLAIHTHNDSDTAVAGSLAAVLAGVEMVQGTINGYGERCGNADLCSVIPNLQEKLGYDCISSSQLSTLTEVSRFVAETFNLIPDDCAPYVGRSAFTHKAGVHVSAVERNPKTYEHLMPSLVGNERKITISTVSGGSNVRTIAKRHGIDLQEDKALAKEILTRVKELESIGYHFEAAEASFVLLMLSVVNQFRPKFQLKDRQISYDSIQEENFLYTRNQATVKVVVGDQEVLAVEEDHGPVSAFDKALRKALVPFFPEINEFQLNDFKVRTLNGEAGSAATIRVLVESSNGSEWWSTIGVSDNLLEASYQAVKEGIEYGLLCLSAGS